MEAHPPCNLKILSLRETQSVSRRDNLFIAVVTSLNRPEIWIFSLRKRVVSFQSSDFRFQISERIQRDRRSKEILELSVFNRYRVAVGAPGRAPVMRGRVFPEGNHQSRSVMIPPETSALWLAFRGYRCAQPPAIYGFFPAGKGVGSWQISDFSHQRAARSCRGARDARKLARHGRKIKEGASESMHPLFIG